MTTTDQTITHDGREWRVIGVGVTDDQGRTYYHLASMTEFVGQRNGRRPKMVGVWLPAAVVAR
jgi:hypothetical protein